MLFGARGACGRIGRRNGILILRRGRIVGGRGSARKMGSERRSAGEGGGEEEMGGGGW